MEEEKPDIEELAKRVKEKAMRFAQYFSTMEGDYILQCLEEEFGKVTPDQSSDGLRMALMDRLRIGNREVLDYINQMIRVGKGLENERRSE